MPLEKIYIGSDHAGFGLKQDAMKFLENKNYSFEDMGSHEYEKDDDFPDYAAKVCEMVLKTESRGILICGTGIGMSIAANKYKGIRAALCYDEYVAEMSRKHNDSNILVLGGRTTKKGTALSITEKWLKTAYFPEERFVRRNEKIRDIDGRN